MPTIVTADSTVEALPPVISVALLIRNGMPALIQLLEALTSQTGCERFEIVALDSRSTDGSIQAMANANVRVEEIDPAIFRFGPARQRVFGMTRGQVIVTLSQDAIPGSRQWLAAMTGPILAGECDLMQAEEYTSIETQRAANYAQVGTAYAHWPMPWISISCAGLAISRKAWLSTGFGEVEMSEDKFLAMGARRLDYRLQINRAVPLIHGHTYTAKALAKRAFNEGMGARKTDGRYSFWQMMHDLLKVRIYRNAAAEVFKYRRLKFAQVAVFPVRPLFLYLGCKIGRRYWR